jgi:hypothetical protein
MRAKFKNSTLHREKRDDAFEKKWRKIARAVAPAVLFAMIFLALVANTQAQPQGDTSDIVWERVYYYIDSSGEPHYIFGHIGGIKDVRFLPPNNDKIIISYRKEDSPTMIGVISTATGEVLDTACPGLVGAGHSSPLTPYYPFAL